MKLAQRTARLGTENAFSVLEEVNGLIRQGCDVVNLGIGDPDPGFPIYESVVAYSGGRPVPLPLVEERAFGFDAEALRRLAGPRTRLIILNSPNNPTGGVLRREDLQVVAEVAREWDCWVLA